MALAERGDPKIVQRVRELIADGYLQRESTPDKVWLTVKGLLALCAMADRPLVKTKLAKTSVAFERTHPKPRKKALF